MRRITGTTIYGYVACPRQVELDLHLDRARRRKLTAGEELVRQRGRDLEAARVLPLAYREPAYERADYETGAKATLELLRAGVPGVAQGVLREGDLLGIPDLLRREVGASALGDFHYVVGDIKSSAGARADQVLQVAFYSRLLGRLQGRVPEYGYLSLKDGREERFALAELDPVLDDVLVRVRDLARGDGERERAFLAFGCRRCHWSELCGATLAEREDLSLLAGMTRGLRTTLEACGVRRVRDLLAPGVERIVRKAQLEAALVRQLQLAARAFVAQEPLDVHDGPGEPEVETAVVHFAYDAFAERVLCFGAAWRDGEREASAVFVPQRGEAWAAFQEMLAAVPAGVRLAHWGPGLPAWFQRAADDHVGDVDLHGRFVDLARRLRARAAFPGPVFTLRDAVRLGLGRDPDRSGDEDEAPLWAAAPDGEARLRAKMSSDLGDLMELVRRWLPTVVAEAAP